MKRTLVRSKLDLGRASEVADELMSVRGDDCKGCLEMGRKSEEIASQSNSINTNPEGLRISQELTSVWI